MYSVIYLSGDRRVKVYEEGGLAQERNINPGFNVSNWVSADDDDWPDLPGVLLKFSTLLFNAHNNAKIV